MFRRYADRMLPLLGTLLTASAADIVPIGGVEFTPLSRGDLVWVDEGRTSGTGVGELDGSVKPALAAFGGAWFGPRIGVVGGLGVARLQSTTWAGETFQSQHWGVVRPSLDLRVGITRRVLKRPALWANLGVHGDIPSARNVSNGYTAEEQELADEDAYLERLRLAGAGARIGLGVDYRVSKGLAIGATYGLTWHRGVLRTNEANIVSSWLAGSASLLLTFEWEKPDS